MEELTLESLAKRVADLEAQLAARREPGPDDWWSVVGMFKDSEFYTQMVAEGAAIRQAERDAIEREDAEQRSTDQQGVS